MNKTKVIAVVGPTASGKTSLAIDIALAHSGEVISVDSRQVYKGLDIGTSKVTEPEMSGVPHHLIDIAAVTDTYTVTNFVADAKRVTQEIIERENLPIFAGGTFFYLDQLRGLAGTAAVSPNPVLRKNLETLSTEELTQQVKVKDPNRFASIDTSNRRRLVRALEIIEELGEVPPVSNMNSPYDWLVLGIESDTTSLEEKYITRANKWLKQGLLDEAAWLEQLVDTERFQEFGFEYILAQKLLHTEINKSEFIQQFIEKNRQYAKRQMTWLKKDKEIKWFKNSQKQEILAAVENFLHGRDD